MGYLRINDDGGYDMDNSFPEIKTLFGFGCMRLPMIGSEVDIEQFKEMTDYFIDNGFNYFDTAHGYIDGKSEKAIKIAVSDRYPREKFLLTNKLSDSYFHSEEEIRPLFQSQLDACGVEYFDFYLMHAQNARNFKQYKECRAYETAFKLKEEGKIKHVGLSFHDKAEVLDEILTTYPDVEIVQIQFNYVDYEDIAIQSRKCYEVCRKHNKPVIVMEPVKGGSLVKLPEAADTIFREMGDLSNASYAIRYAASFEGIRVVLSGMSDMAQMKDNVSYMKDFKPLSDEEMGAVARVTAVYRGLSMIPCTSCHYCVEQNHCPMNIMIPEMFACLNTRRIFDDWNQKRHYADVLTAGGNGKASSCIECGGCEAVCPQHLEIRSLLKDVAAEFEG